jgi:hypothetical protein
MLQGNEPTQGIPGNRERLVHIFLPSEAVTAAGAR